MARWLEVSCVSRPSGAPAVGPLRGVFMAVWVPPGGGGFLVGSLSLNAGLIASAMMSSNDFFLASSAFPCPPQLLCFLALLLLLGSLLLALRP